MDTAGRVMEIVCRYTDCPVDLETRFSEDLGFSSYRMMIIISVIKTELHLAPDYGKTGIIRSVSDLVEKLVPVE